MNSRVIKIIALAAMLADHIGVVLFPALIWLRIVGRIAFPVFCFLIAYGATKTRNIWRYLLRLFVFALVTQVALSLVLWEVHVSWLNVFFTLSAGVLSIILVQKIKEERSPAITVAVCLLIVVMMLAAQLLLFDYGMMGVFLIIMFYLPLSVSVKQFKSFVLPALIIFNLPFGGIQWASLTALIPLLLFKDKKLKISKWERWAFYAFYPLHLVILHAVAQGLFG